MTNKIPLFQIRDFSDKFSATFDFVRQNWRVFLRMALYIWLPFSIVQGVFLNTYYSVIFSDAFFGDASFSDDLPWPMIALLGVLSLVSLIVIWAVTYGLMKLYEQGDGDLSNLTLHDFLPILKRDTWRMCKVVLAYVAMYIVFVLAGVLLGVVGGILTFGLFTFFLVLIILAAIVVLMPPLSLFPAVYLLDEESTLWDALKTSFRYGFKTWGGLFALLFVFGIIIYAASGFLMLPGLLMSIFKSTIFPATFTGSGVLPVLYTIVQDIIVIVTNFIAWLLMPLPLIAVGFHYGHAAELLDNVSVAGDIDHFDELADKSEDYEEIPSDDNAIGNDKIDDFNNL